MTMKVYHPDLAGDQVAEVTEEAFSEVWEPLGWKEWVDHTYDPAPPEEISTGTSPDDPKSSNKE